MPETRNDPWRVPGLDGLRAVAIGSVIVWHVTLVTRFPTERFGALQPFVLTTWAGVDLFFALSGFLITSLLLREERRHAAAGLPATFSLRNFYVRRALRILPVFYVVFAILALALARSPVFRSVNVAELAARRSPFGLWPYALFLGNYFEACVARFPGAASPGNAFLVFWSLCVEEHFYLLWPLALRALPQPAARRGVALGACLALPVLRYAALDAGAVGPVPMHLMSHFRFDSLLWGAFAALTLDGAWLRDRPRRALLLAVGASLCALVATRALSFRPHGTAFGTAFGLGALALGGALIVADFALRPTDRVAVAMDRAPLRLVGRLSYAMYLVHFPAIDVAKRIVYSFSRAPSLLNLGLLVALTAAISAAAAWALHVTVERPFLALKQRFSA